jgi:hypothetical protein
MVGYSYSNLKKDLNRQERKNRKAIRLAAKLLAPAIAANKAATVQPKKNWLGRLKDKVAGFFS